jgi:hypothetical protein
MKTYHLYHDGKKRSSITVADDDHLFRAFVNTVASYASVYGDGEYLLDDREGDTVALVIIEWYREDYE